MREAGPIRFLTCCAIALLLAGCGFRPAGTLQASGLAGTRIVDVAGGSDVAWALSRQLDLYGVPEPAANMGAARTLRLIDEGFDRRQVSVDGNARTAEFQLVARATFELLGADGKVLIPQRTITADSIYQRDRNNLLGSSGEERQLKDELRQDLVRRILSAVSVVAGSSDTQPGAS